MKTFKVLQLVTSLSDGGAETLVKDYAIILNNKIVNNIKIEISILCVHNYKKSANYERIKRSEVKLYTVYRNHNKLVSLHRKLFGRYYVSKKIKLILDAVQPDCIHTHLHVLPFLIPFKESLMNYNLFYTCHNDAKIMLDGSHRSDGDAARILIESCGLIPIALHNKMTIDMNHILRTDKTIVVNNGVDFSQFGDNVREGKSNIQSSLDIPQGSFVVGHIGRFSDQKNHEFLIRVFNDLLLKKPNAFLLLVGTGPNKSMIKKLAEGLKISHRVLMLSNRIDTPRLYKAMDVYVFPSLYEGLSVSLVEAQVSGLKCVVSDRIDSQSILSEKTLVVSLNAAVSDWTEAIISDECNNNHGNLADFDMNNIAFELLKLYMHKKT